MWIHRGKNRTSGLVIKRQKVVESFIQSRYVVLAFIWLLLSVMITKVSNQFIALAVIFGLKWAFAGPMQVIQVFTKERGGEEWPEFL